MKSKKRAEPQREVRTLTAALPMTFRTAADGSKQIGGYAIVFNSASSDLGGFKEIVSPSALNRTLKENPDVLALRDHKQELLLGRTTAGTLDLRVDSTGLAFTITLPKTPIGEDTAENVRLRNLSGVSFGFQTVEDSWQVDSDGNVIRTLLDINLLEISPTSFAAYTAAAVAIRSCPLDIRCKLNRDDDEEEDQSDYRPECDDESELFDPDANCGDDAEEEDDDRRRDSLRIRTLFARRMNA